MPGGAARRTVLDASKARPAAPRPDPRRQGRARTGAPPRRAARPRRRRPRKPACPAPADRARSRRAHRPSRPSRVRAALRSLIAARPSGAAITVSLPLSSTTAPLARAACRARSSLPPDGVGSAAEQARELALVRGHDAVRLDRADRRTAPRCSSANTVSASASRTVRFRAASAASTLSRVSGPMPAPGPISTALRLGSASSSRNALDPGGGLHDDPGQRAGIDRKRRLGRRDRNQPGARPAPRPARRAARRRSSPRPRRSAHGRACICGSPGPGHGNSGDHQSG